MQRLFLFSALFTATLLGSAVSWALPERTIVPLAYDSNRLYLAGEISYEKYATPVDIPFEDWSTISTGPLRALGRYYLLMKQNVPEDIVNLYFEADGSRERLVELIDKNPSYYENFSALATVTLLDHAVWGNYDLYRVLLEGGGSSAETGIGLFCDVLGCLLSDWIETSRIGENVTGTLELIASIVDSLSIDDTIIQESVERMRQAGNQQPLLPPLFDTQGMTRPVILLADLLKLPEPLIGLNEPPNDDLPEAIRFMIGFLQAVRASDDDGLEAVVTSDWTAGTDDGVVTMAYRAQKTDENDVVIDEETEIRDYTWEAFKTRVETWGSVRILGYAPLDEQVFIFVQPVEEGNKSHVIQLFTVQYDSVEMTYKLVSDSDQSFVWTIIREPVFLDFITARYGVD